MDKKELEKLKKFFETTFKNYIGDHNYNESQKDFSVSYYVRESVKRDALQTLFENYV